MYPDDPLQPGPIYFLVQRCCGLFGVHAEGLSSQVNYLIDEAASTGKGANCVTSYLHHYLTQFSLGEKEMHLHADNCVGQNKNSFMMQYLAWRVLSGLHTTISIHFMLRYLAWRVLSGLHTAISIHFEHAAVPGMASLVWLTHDHQHPLHAAVPGMASLVWPTHGHQHPLHAGGLQVRARMVFRPHQAEIATNESVVHVRHR